MARHRVLLVREWDEQLSGSGCCGRLGSEAISTVRERAADPYAHTRAGMARAGAVYRALREAFGEDRLDVAVVDPRNTVWLLPAVWRDARRRGLSPWVALRRLNAATTAGALVCDGVVLATDPEPERAVALVRADLVGATR
ncbi:hypothetical protein SAMN05421810_11450 [Amycolatopsis arida]|uniref:Uncharacterized protein n=1 Tax=Amycolatopsis arida TaxID=587909 RepID=A0A1I6ARU9_9PSEU|nr:hypothetical protein [Amycolatopsis arida]TDX97573.1 hypothetical protein CLV69_102677 [Amycolatopsis arida]SFQ71430.1 hypothetical protein SAMN05421810_11450 [Amycolatopsis arida]